MAVSTAVDASAVARVLGIKTAFVNLKPNGTARLPQRVAVIGQGNTASTYVTTKRTVTSAQTVGELYGFGSPLHIAAKQLLPSNNDGLGNIPLTVYPLEADGSGIASAGDITPTGTATETGTLFVLIANTLSLVVSVAVGDTVADLTAAITTALNSVIDMPMIATDNTTDVGLASKWKGASANGLVVSISGEVAGLTFAVTQPVSGATNPDVDPALAQVGDIWETMILNCMDAADTATFDKFATWNEGRWGALVMKPAVVFFGNTEATAATAITVTDARTTDRTNCQLVAPGSDDFPAAVAARQLARLAVVANENPPHDYGSQSATNLIPGTDAEQWDYADRDLVVKGGSSTTEVRDGIVAIGDVVTMYHPVGDPTPAYRYVVDIVKLQNILFNQHLIFATAEWDGAPLIPDDQPTTNRSAKKPRMAKAEVASMIDNLGLAAILSDPATAKETIVAEIDVGNPKRLNIAYTVQLSGNTNIISIDFNFGFYFGTPSVVA